MRGVRDGMLLAVGTFSRIPVPPPRQVTRWSAGLAMVLGPLVGLLLALVASVVLLAGRWWLGGGTEPLVAAGLAIAAMAWLTAGLHLDGLADVADGLGSHRPAPQALDVMRRSDIGPMGVVTVVLVLLVQVLALSQAIGNGGGTEALVLAVVTGRVAIMLSCLRGIPAARPEGLGAAVAGSVPWLAAALVVGVLVVAADIVGGADSETSARLAVLAVVAGLGAGLLALGVCARRFGGVTGDVLGAVGELATTAVLLVMAGSPDIGSPDWTWLPF